MMRGSSQVASQMTHYALMHYVLNCVVYEFNTVILSFIMESEAPPPALLRKAVTVECVKCPIFHTLFFTLIKCFIRVFKVCTFYVGFSV